MFAVIRTQVQVAVKNVIGVIVYLSFSSLMSSIASIIAEIHKKLTFTDRLSDYF